MTKKRFFDSLENSVGDILSPTEFSKYGVRKSVIRFSHAFSIS